ncbi:MAG: DJ-1/PfpI family protein [Bacilli bacterium]|nr:DJ-1/PfpI family protein [Bacilli bacterium]MBN2696474.1 DJ-1/PfpI family protein [Bacilli bacterium]
MRIACLLADGFEDIEALGTVAILRRSGIEVDFVNAMNKNTAIGSYTTEVVTALPIRKLSVKDYDGLFIPGGRQAMYLRESETVLNIVKEFSASDKWLIAICAGPTVFGVLGLLDGKRYTSFPTTESFMPKGIRLAKPAVTDGKIITGVGAGAVYEFALEIIEKLLGEAKKQEIKRRILYREFE